MLPPQKVFPFVEDLIKANELFVGCDGWRYVDRSKNWIVQDLGINFSVEEYFSWDEMTPEKNLELLPSFLNDLPENIDLISVDLNDPEVTARIIEEISK